MAAFFLGRHWDTLSRLSRPRATTSILPVGVNTDAGVTGAIIVNEANFPVKTMQAGAE
jgi:hypothetical protein